MGLVSDYRKLKQFCSDISRVLSGQERIQRQQLDALMALSEKLERDAKSGAEKKSQTSAQPTDKIERPADSLLQPVPSQKFKNNRPKLIGHGKMWPWLSTIANDPSIKVLEVGSRAVTNPDGPRKRFLPTADYVGFDYLAGTNVDVVGDAHRLSDYFENESFDVVVSSAVFEHLAMPWIVAEEISKVLKVDGHVAIETHFSFAEHEMPWNFFQFHYLGLQYLFNEALGFATVDAGFTNPMVAWFSSEADAELVGKRISNVYCHSSLLSRKERTILTKESGAFDWRSTLPGLTDKSSYPEGTGFSRTDTEEKG